jgi:predicted AlkP superfamily pyrophosphatase or phosphodiesterase
MKKSHILLAGALMGLAAPSSFAAPAPQKRPRLVVEIVVDQMRPDYLDRFGDLLLPAGRGQNIGGFRWLRERGADFAAARYPHFPLFTAPGHAVVSTGGYPYKTGIVGNDWFDQSTRAPMYSVSDSSAKVISDDPASKAKPMSPRNLRSSTLGDELKMATGGKAKVVSLALKDRPAIILGGRLSDTSIWFDGTTGRWISSDAYCKNGQLPAWVQAFNARGIPKSRFGQNWSTDLLPAVANRGWKPAGAPPIHPVYGLGEAFPHPVRGGQDAPGEGYYKAWELTPWANDFVFETAEKSIGSEGLGQDNIPDLLAFNLSTNDYVGHAFGPDSPEMLDITVQTDRRLAQFFRFLDRNIPGGLANVTIALTADHGVAPVPEDLEAAGFRAGRLEKDDVVAAAQTALADRFGAGKWVLDYVEPSLYLDNEALRQAKIDPEGAQKVAAQAIGALDGIYATYTGTQIQDGRLPQNDIGERIAKGYYPKVSGDVMVITEGNYFIETSAFKNNTTHGTVYSYDTRVPILMAGFGIHPGVFYNEVSPADIAPTLSLLLGTAYPSACDGKPLLPALNQ